jgi:hypothetical protein
LLSVLADAPLALGVVSIEEVATAMSVVAAASGANEAIDAVELTAAVGTASIEEVATAMSVVAAAS